ncbi:MAG: endonuclease MutS2 [Clostridia bacterium]
MQQRTLKALEYQKILAKIAHYASSQTAMDNIMTMQPMQSIEDINKSLDEVVEADKILFQHSVTLSFAFDDVSMAIDKAKVLSVLTPAELLRIAHLLMIARNLQSQIAKVPDDSIVLLKQVAKEIYTNKKLEDDIDKAIQSETELKDTASPELRSIRAKIRRIGENIKAKLYNFVNSAQYSKYIQDNIVTMRNDRYVVPLKAECKGSIPGLIHDQSASGATLYVEPMVIVELNNELKSLVLDENKEIERILREFTFRISGECDVIEYTFKVITNLDIIFAKAYYGNSIKGIRPEFNNKGYIDIVKARHPLIEKNKVVSNSIYLGKEFNMLFITGPNTGGKTVCIKLVGIITLMGMSGMFVPAESAMLYNFDDVFCDIGDEQSIEQNLSTFSGHMTNVINILNKITSSSLVLFDELGAGTDPTEGASLATSISDYILKNGTKAVITTHYNELKEFALVMDGVQNASMDFNPLTYSPTYHLCIGTPGASNALIIAEKLGLSKAIVDKARQGISTQKFEFEEIVLSLEKAKKEAESNKKETEALKIEQEEKLKEIDKEREKLYLQRERLNVSVRKETKRLVEETMEEANEIIDELRKLLDEPDQSTIFKAQKLRKTLKKYEINEENEFSGMSESLDGEIVVGDWVLINSLNSEGEVIAVNPIKKEAKVKLGGIITNVKLNNLQRLKKSVNKKNKEKSKAVAVSQPFFNEQVPKEINLIGLNSEESLTKLQEYIDKCVRVGMHETRIIHGYGEGILRKAIQSYLKTRKEIELFRDGNFYEGGKGATYVMFK